MSTDVVDVFWTARSFKRARVLRPFRRLRGRSQGRVARLSWRNSDYLLVIGYQRPILIAAKHIDSELGGGPIMDVFDRATDKDRFVR